MTNETKGQTLQDLNVKAGDVVECVEWIGDTYKAGDVVTYGDVWMSHAAGLWRIITRASDPQWLPCPSDYTSQDNHEVTYHMGVPTHYYVNGPVVVDVEKRVYFEISDNMGCIYYHSANATLRGQTYDGKPVGQWVIDMDKAE